MVMCYEKRPNTHAKCMSTHVISCRLTPKCVIRCSRRDTAKFLSPFLLPLQHSTMATQKHQVFPSILDNDLYKFTMQYAVLQHYRDAEVVYEFTNRDKELQLNVEAAEWLEKQIKGIDSKLYVYLYYRH